MLPERATLLQKLSAAARRADEMEAQGVGNVRNPEFVAIETYIGELKQELLLLSKREFDDENRRLREPGAVR